MRAIFLAIAGVLSAGWPVCRAAEVETTWKGPASGDWNVATSWTGGVVPNNVGDTTYHAILGNAARPLVTGAISVDRVTLDRTATLELRRGGHLTAERALTFGPLMDPLRSGLRLVTGAELVLGAQASLAGSTTIELVGLDAYQPPLARLYTTGDQLTLGSGLRVRRSSITSSALDVEAVIGSANASLLSEADIDLALQFGDRVDLAGSSVENQGVMRFAGNNGSPPSRMTVGSTFINGGTFAIENGTKYEVDAAQVRNTGSIAVRGGAVLFLNASLDNTGGSIVVDQSTFGVGGTVNQDSLASMQFNSGELISTGAYDNAGQVFRHTDTSLPWRVAGTFKGGSIQTDAARPLLFVAKPYGTSASPPAVLDDASVDGYVKLQTTLTIPSGQALRGTGVIEGGSIESTADLTVESGMTLHAINGVHSAGKLTNRGVISDALFVIGDAGLENLGSIRTSTRTWLGGTYTREDLGHLASTGNGRFVIGGTLLNEGRVFEVGGDTPNWQLAGTVRGGAIHIAEGASLIQVYSNDAVLDDVEINGRLSIGQSIRTLFPSGRIYGNADIGLGPPALEGPTRLLGNEQGLEIAPSVRISGFPAYAELHPASGIDAGEFGVLTNMGTIAAVPSPYTFPEPSKIEKGVSLWGALVRNGGTIAASPKSNVDVYGPLEMLPGGALKVSVNDLGEAGLIRVHGDVDLVALADAFLIDAPANLPIHTSFIVLEYDGNLTGVFNTVTPNWRLTFDTIGSIRATLIPEPATLLGGMVLFTPTRRRSSRFTVV